MDLKTPVFGIRVPRYWLRLRWGDPIWFTLSPITGVTYGTGGDMSGSDSPFPAAAVQRRTGSPVYFLFAPKPPGGAGSLVEGEAQFPEGIVSAFWMSAPRRAICPRRARRVHAPNPVA